MPRKMLMSFTLAKHRWRKMYKKKNYEVYCSQLGISEDLWTEEKSYQAANAWWLAKKAEIDAVKAEPALPKTVKAVLSALKQKIAYCEREGLADEAELYTGRLGDVQQQLKSGDYDLPEADPRSAAKLDLIRLLGDTPVSELDPTTLDALTGADELWADRTRRDKPIVQSRQVGTHLKEWYELVSRRADPTSLVNIHGYFQEFKDIRSGDAVLLREDMDVGVIDEARYEAVYKAFDDRPWSAGTKKKKWGYFRQFVGYLAEKKLISLPNNFRSKLLTFTTKPTSKSAPDVAAIRVFLDSLPDRLRLYALLALNCGMNNVDIGKLRPGEVDWRNRTLTRKRHKTEDSERVPVVTYALWGETYCLLDAAKTGSGQYLLLSQSGEPLYGDEKIAGKGKLYDRIKSQWRDHFKRGTKKPYTLKDFRFFGADLLRASTKFRSYRDAFLGHAPRSTGDRSYSSDEDVSAACRHLEGLFYPKVGGTQPPDKPKRRIVKAS